MRTSRFCLLTIFATLAAITAVSAQETQTRVVDEVVAQVNNSVITLSGVRREAKNAVDSLVQQGQPREEAQKLVDEKQGELIANLINEQLLIDKAKDMGLDREIEGMVLQKLDEIRKQLGVKTVEAVYAEMDRNGFNPDDLKDTWRRQFIKEQVIQREVQGKLYWGFSGRELKDHYEKHKDKFTKPETVSFSELFLGFAGRDEASVREKAKQLYAQLKAGGDWAKIVEENGDKGAVTQGAGSVEKVRVKELPELLSKPIAGVKSGDVTAPIEIKDLGMAILKIDTREAASSESVYNENAVRLAMMSERFPDEQRKYMAKLRREGYIEIRDTYRPVVSPVLFADERTETTNQKVEKSDEAPTKNAKEQAPPESSSQKTSSKKDQPKRSQ